MYIITDNIMNSIVMPIRVGESYYNIVVKELEKLSIVSKVYDFKGCLLIVINYDCEQSHYRDMREYLIRLLKVNLSQDNWISIYFYDDELQEIPTESTLLYRNDNSDVFYYIKNENVKQKDDGLLIEQLDDGFYRYIYKSNSFKSKDIDKAIFRLYYRFWGSSSNNNRYIRNGFVGSNKANYIYHTSLEIFRYIDNMSKVIDLWKDKLILSVDFTEDNLKVVVNQAYNDCSSKGSLRDKAIEKVIIDKVNERNYRKNK